MCQSLTNLPNQLKLCHSIQLSHLYLSSLTIPGKPLGFVKEQGLLELENYGEMTPKLHALQFMV